MLMRISPAGRHLHLCAGLFVSLGGAACASEVTTFTDADVVADTETVDGSSADTGTRDASGIDATGTRDAGCEPGGACDLEESVTCTSGVIACTGGVAVCERQPTAGGSECATSTGRTGQCSEGRCEPAACEENVYPNFTQKLEMTYEEAHYFPFGESTGGTIRERFSIDRFLALSDFFTDRTDFRRRIATFPASPADGRPWYAMSWSLSECPGDFTETATCRGVLVPYGEMFFSTRPSDGDPAPGPDYCIMQPGVRYYLNFVHDVEPYDETMGRCADPSDTSCAILTSEVAS